MKNIILVVTTVSCTGGLTGLLVYFWYQSYKKHGKNNIPMTGFLEKCHETIVFPQRIHIVSSIEHIQCALEKIYRDIQIIRIVGLDCEWLSDSRPVGKVALVQITTPAGNTFLFRLCLFDKKTPFPQSLLTFFNDKSILKTGVAVVDDGHKLMKDYGISIRGCVDVRYLVIWIIKSLCSSDKLGLKNLAKILLGIELDKSLHVRCSNWEDEHLDQQQVMYAALDSFISLDLFLSITAMKCSNIQYHSDSVGWTALQTKARSLVNGIVDIKFKRKGFSLPVDICPDLTHQMNNKISSNSHCDIHSSVAKARKSYSQRKSRLYDNCELRAPDGSLLSTIDRKKADWYLDKGLGEIVCDDPYTVRMNFEPSGRPADGDRYYQLPKENKCAVCGSEESCVRKYIVPHEYRRHFPATMKNHISHDILLMCIDCHVRSNFYDGEMRKLLAEQCLAPIGSENHVRLNYEDRTRVNVRSSAMALLKNRDRIPSQRIEELLSVIKKYHNIDDITDSILQETAELETKVFNESYVPHGLLVVRHYTACDSDGLQEFVKLWRQRFVEKMQPQHLPELWSVEHHVECIKSIQQGEQIL